MSSLQQHVRRTIRRQRLCPPGTRVLVALSGGSDSVALTLLLLELAPNLDFEVAGLAHVNHQLRATADRDEAFCRALASRLGLAILVPHADVKEVATRQQLSIEEAARLTRYARLDEAAAALGASRIAVGHTVDDQAETFMLKLARGAGATGLGAIYPRRERIIRPLLDVTRGELREYLAARGERWVEDETNADVSNPRNRVRHEVLPLLERALGLPARRAFARAAALVGEDAQFLDELAEEQLRDLAVDTGETLELDAERLRAAPAPLARRVLLRAIRGRSDGREVGLEHVLAALDVLGGQAAAADLPGCRVELRGKKLVLYQ